MAFWKRKKEVVEEKKVEEAPPKVEYFVETLAKVYEREYVDVEIDKVRNIRDERKIIIENKSPFPLFSINIELENTENTDLSSKIVIPKLEPAGSGAERFEKAYGIKKYKLPIEIHREIAITGRGSPVLFYGEENEVSLSLSVKSLIPLEKMSIEIEIPAGFEAKVLEKNSPEEPIMSANRILWNLEPPDVNKMYTIKTLLKGSPTESEHLAVGSCRIISESNKASFSGVIIRDISATVLLNYSLKITEISGTHGKWQTILYIQNSYSKPVSIEGDLEVLNGRVILEETSREHWDIPQENKLILRDVIAHPGTLELGPIVIESKEKPKIKVAIGGKVQEEKMIDALGEYNILPQLLNILKIHAVKDVAIVTDPTLKDLFEKNELPTIGENLIEVSYNIKNEGSAMVNYIEIVEDIPAFLGEIIDLSAKIGRSKVTIEKQTVSSEARKNKIKMILKDINLDPGKTLEINYKLKPTEIPAKAMTIELPAEIRPSVDGGKTIARIIPETPIVLVRPVKRDVEIQRIVDYLGEDTFLIKIIVTNNSDIPLPDHEIKILIPKDFDVLEAEPQASSEETESGTIILWRGTLDIGSREFLIKVRGKGAYNVSDLLAAEIS